MKLNARLLVLTDTGDNSGLLFDGCLLVDVNPDHESLSMACLSALRERAIFPRPGDVLFFPDSAAGHRYVKVTT